MSTGTLRFNLLEEGEEFETALQAGLFKGVIQDFDNYLRSINKHGHEDFKDEKEQDAAQKIRDKLYELLQENNIQLW